MSYFQHSSTTMTKSSRIVTALFYIKLLLTFTLFCFFSFCLYFCFTGEHGEWCKHTNFELATHAPMMVHVPGLTDQGIVTEQLTEFVDLYPTLAEAAGLPKVGTELGEKNGESIYHLSCKTVVHLHTLVPGVWWYTSQN